MTPGAEVGHEDDGDDVSDLVHGRDDAGDAGRDLVALLDGRDDGVQVARGQGLLQRHQQRQKKHEHLE